MGSSLLLHKLGGPLFKFFRDYLNTHCNTIFTIKKVKTLKIINKISDGVFQFEKLLAILLTSVIFISLAAGVIFRYIFKNPLIWSDELAIFCLVWITFIGGSMGLKEKASPSITMLLDAVPPTIQKGLRVLSNVILLGFVGYVLYLAYYWISAPNIMVQVSPTLNLQKFYFYLSIPVSFTFMVIHVFNSIIEIFQEDKKGAQQ